MVAILENLKPPKRPCCRWLENERDRFSLLVWGVISRSELTLVMRDPKTLALQRGLRRLPVGQSQRERC